MSERQYLRQNIVAEPLFNQWYAWPYLIPPASAAMYVANWHLKIMRSFVSAPQVHVAALKNPAMLGGPFINYEPARANDIKELMNRTVDEQAPMIELAEALPAWRKRLPDWGEQITLVHGDCKHSQCMLTPDGVAILDFLETSAG